MKKRRSHQKSRQGCRGCKIRHIKCDEQGPPCANCVARKTECVYSEAGADTSRAFLTPGGSETSSSQEQTPHDSLQSPESRRLLELELMHRWSTSTYKGLGSMPEEAHIMQHVVPREALKHECLMDGILALSSLDIALSNGEAESAAYTRIAITYYDRSVSSFRERLGDVNRGNHAVLFMLSVMIGLINLALLRCPVQDVDDQPSVIKQVAAVFDLLSGPASLAAADWHGLMESYYPARVVLNRTIATPDLLDPSTAGALARLRSVNDEFSTYRDDQIQSTTQDEPSFHELYRKAIADLQVCFAEEAKGEVRGWCIAFPKRAGRSFSLAVESAEPMSLLILLHWAVLVDRIGTQAWWAASVGEILVAEASAILQRSELALVPGFEDVIAWTREQVGLPTLP